MTLVITIKLTALVRLAHIVATVAVVWLASPPGPATSAAAEIGKAAPALVVNALDGTTFDLAKLLPRSCWSITGLRGVRLVARKCRNSTEFYKRYHAQGLEIIGISIDFERDFEKARKVAQAVTYPTAVAKAITEDGFRRAERRTDHLDHRC